MKKYSFLFLLIFLAFGCFVLPAASQTSSKKVSKRFEAVQVADNDTEASNVFETANGMKIHQGWKRYDSFNEAKEKFNLILSEAVEILENEQLGKTSNKNNAERVVFIDKTEKGKKIFRILRLQDEYIYFINAPTLELVKDFEKWQKN